MRDSWTWIIPGGASISYLLLLAKIGISISERFYIALYAVMVTVVVMGIKTFMNYVCYNHLQIIDFQILVWVAVMLLQGWNQGIDQYLYKDTEKFTEIMDIYGHLDVFYVDLSGSEGISRNMMWNFVDLSRMDSVTFFKNNVRELEHMEEKKHEPEYILYMLNTEMSEEKEEEILMRVKEYCPQITKSDLLGHWGWASVYHIYGE